MHVSHPIAALLTSSLIVAQSGWSTPTLVAELNTSASDTGPHLAADGLTVHFGSFRGGDWEIWSAVRPAPGMPFAAPVLEAALGSSSTESGPFLSADGLEILYESLRAGGQGGFDLMISKRPTTSAPWGPPSFITEVNSTGSEASPSMTADGTELYMLSTSWGAPFAPNNSIFVASRAGATGAFGTPTAVPSLAATQGSTDSHRDVQVSPDGLRIVFTRYQPSLGRLNVFEARRTSRAQPFGAPVMLPEFVGVGTLLGIYSASVSADGGEMLLAAGFSAAAGSQEIMVSRYEGLTTNGVASTSTSMSLHYRDSASPGSVYAFALSGGNTGFALGARNVPLDADPILLATLGTDLPGLNTGFVGLLSGSGEAVAQVRNPVALFAGLHLWVGAFTFDPAAPFQVKTISNAVEIELH